MSVRIDPEDTETPALFDFAGSFEGQRVLEIGCGDGRLTWLYAEKAAYVMGIDPDADEIRFALEDRPWPLRERIDFQAVGIQQYDAPEASFDMAILSWAL